jgi:predicted nuclease with RNAse H fold
MRTVGIDLAADPRRTAACTIDWSGPSITIGGPPVADDRIVELVTEADRTGVDVPFGWPDSFVEVVGAHQRGAPWPHDHDGTAELRLRLTDRWVQQHHRLVPLSVSADRIGVAAMRWARLESTLSARGVEIDRSGLGGAVAETYPAGALRLWGLRATGYKRAAGREALAELVDSVVAQCGSFGTTAGPALAGCSDDQLDAFLCAVLAREVAVGHTTAPVGDQVAVARREGWIHLPTRPLADVLRIQPNG